MFNKDSEVAPPLWMFQLFCIAQECSFLIPSLALQSLDPAGRRGQGHEALCDRYSFGSLGIQRHDMGASE